MLLTLRDKICYVISAHVGFHCQSMLPKTAEINTDVLELAHSKFIGNGSSKIVGLKA